jgi:glycogen phosphorylase
MKTAARTNVFDRLDRLARNMWWTWNSDAQRLFAAMDPSLWDATHHNPLRTIKLLTPERRRAVANDANFSAHLARIEDELGSYLKARTWFDRTHKRRGGDALIAYFCAEFAVHESLPQYSGGLGVLAGDHVKSASDLGVPFVAVGLLYRCGYYTQEFRADGSTRVIHPLLDFAECPIADTGKIVDVPMGVRTVKAKIWRQRVGRVLIHLLDTDIPQNKPKDRELTRHLYGGDREYRIQQEMLLGIGGVIALDAMNLRPTVYHLNEGHAAFCALERLRRLVRKGEPLDRATKIVRRSTVFTTHTPVPAGNDRFAPALTMKYLGGIAKEMQLSKDELLALGREEPANKSEDFCMTVLALKLAAHCNGVAELHGDTSRRMWTKVYGLTPEQADEVPIGSVTNGVHAQTWLAQEMGPLYDRYLRPKWIGAGPEDNWWENVGRIPDVELWRARRTLRARMIGFIRDRLAKQVLRQNGSADELAAARVVLDEDALTIGFARRFATYKRAPLIFKDAKRLARIIRDDKRPVQLVFAGKAHPQDVGGQAFAQEIYRHARTANFRGKVVLLEDYDLELGRVLTSGCDVWLNNPLRPQEASGTSGMKPPLHGGLNCSILDGWWPESFNKVNGWSIGDGRPFADQKKQDKYDADAIYELLENEIVPQFYARRRDGLAGEWIKRMKDSMKTVCPVFNTHRMVGEYVEKYYLPAHASSRE